MLFQARSHACALIIALVPVAHGDLEQDLANGDFTAAEAELEAIALEWKSSEPDHPDAGRALLALGAVERRLGKPDEAIDHLREALRLLERADAPESTEAREALALAFQDAGELAEAEALLRANLPLGDLRTLDHLGIVLLQLGRYHECGEMLERALAATPAADTRDLARRHGLLARRLHTLGSHARALGELETALRLAPADDPELILSLESDRALAHLRLGDLDEARSGFDRCAVTARTLFSARPIDALPHLVNQGSFALAENNPDEALARFTETYELLRSTGRETHPAAIPVLNNLGVAEQRLGKYGVSRRHLERAAALQNAHFPELHLRAAEIARNLAATALLAGDADASILTRAANRTGLDLLEHILRDGSEVERLNFLQRVDLVSLSCVEGDADAIARLLFASKARLLDRLIDPSADNALPPFEALSEALDPDCALIDFCRYTPPGGKPAYGAVVHTRSAPPAWILLASEASIRSWIDALELRLSWKAASLAGHPADPPPFRLEGILRELHQLCFQPLAEALPPECRRLALSPDGLLHAIPFAALRDPEGRWLCESFDLATRIDSGRDLLADSPHEPLDARPWTIAEVTGFDLPGPPSDSPLGRLLAVLPPLPGAHDEVARLSRLAPPGSTRLVQTREQDLRRVATSPGVLHLATHSLFTGSEGPDAHPLDFDRSADLLFSSAIAFARPASDEGRIDPDDDLLFPQEIVGLPLGETRLVTLSSCRSAAGTSVRGGETLGLRRAFVRAGASEVVSALWPVSDASSPVFMEKFYQRALATGHPAQALWETQRHFLGDRRDPEAAILRAAPFILTQRGPVMPVVDAADVAHRPFPWKWMLLAIPPALVFAGRRLRRR